MNLEWWFLNTTVRQALANTPRCTPLNLLVSDDGYFMLWSGRSQNKSGMKKETLGPFFTKKTNLNFQKKCDEWQETDSGRATEYLVFDVPPQNQPYRLISKVGLTNSYMSTLYQDCSPTTVRSQNDLKVPRKLNDVTCFFFFFGFESTQLARRLIDDCFYYL